MMNNEIRSLLKNSTWDIETITIDNGFSVDSTGICVVLHLDMDVPTNNLVLSNRMKRRKEYIFGIGVETNLRAIHRGLRPQVHLESHNERDLIDVVEKYGLIINNLDKFLNVCKTLQDLGPANEPI